MPKRQSQHWLVLEGKTDDLAGDLVGQHSGNEVCQQPRSGQFRRLEALIAPHYPVAGRGRRPYPLGVMLRVHFLQHWYGYSDPAMVEALHDIPVLRRFAGLDAGISRLPDETTILNFRHLLEAHELAQAMFQEVVHLLAEQGLILREGTIVDATLIAAPPSTKNRAHQRDPEMTSSKTANQWHFGMKAPVGVDTAHGLVHTMVATTGRVSDYSMAETLLHGEEMTAHGDRGYYDRSREPDRTCCDDEVGPRWFVPFKRQRGRDTTHEQKRLNRIMAALRSAVEHPFRVLKRQFGHTRVRYRGLFKNEQHLFSQFALVNL